jgi:hypothetical protein
VTEPEKAEPTKTIEVLTAEHAKAVREQDSLTKIITGIEGGLRILNAQRTAANAEMARTKEALVQASLKQHEERGR